MDWVAAIGAFAVGTLLSYVNRRISASALRSASRQLSGVFMARQAINAGYLLVLFFLGMYTKLSLNALLIGGALGVTIPSFLFTVMLLRDREPGEDGKENRNG